MQLMITLVALILSAQGVPTDNVGRIVNGHEATRGEFPWLVSISENGQHICGGFIYSDRNIVTTASCLFGKANEALKVKVGAFVLETPEANEQNIEVLSVSIYPSFDHVYQMDDLALINIKRPIVFSDTVKPIRYEELVESLHTATIAGWGVTSEGGVWEQRLHKTNVFNLTADCRFYGQNEYSFNYMICAGDGTTSPCDYDQGSPLVQSSDTGNIVVGIMSKNRGCVAPYPPTIYTRLSSYYPWLKQTAGQQPANL
ncbi:trypsin-1-like [Daphnia pulicaria]|uniref:trypsin-1-like n=1 Tax=Daphnia pulicaria TaxID=35523 RepID=UPI001EEC0F1B|nr:trypsin-1-like [Daphnia pulicaria]